MVKEFNVLILQDDDAHAGAMAQVISIAGYQAIYSRVLGLTELCSSLIERRWDLVLTDYQLKEFSVFNLLKIIEQFGTEVPVIVITDKGGEGRVVAAMEAGVVDFLLRDDLSRLNPVIERVLHQSENRQREVALVRELKEEEQRLRRLTDNFQGAYWIVDNDTSEVVYINDTFEDIWERPREQMVSNPHDFLLEATHPEDYSRIEELLSGSWEELNVEYRIVLPDDSVRWVSTRTIPISDEYGKQQRLAGITTDITHSKEMEAGVMIMTRALEQTADVVMISDIDGRLTFVNRAFEEVTGYSREEVIGKRPSVLKSGLQDEPFYQSLWASLSGGLPFTDIFLNRRRDGEIYYHEQTITPVKNEKGEVSHFVSTGKDITNRLKAEERLHNVMHYHVVTGMANRILLLDRLEQAAKSARRVDEMIGILCFGFDLGKLLEASDGKGLEEQLLREIASRFNSCTDEFTTVAQLSDEQFVVVYQRPVEGEDFVIYAQRLLERFAEPISAGGYQLYLTPSVGIAVFPEGGEEMEELLQNAQQAMSYAHNHPGENCLYYGEKMRSVNSVGAS